MVKPALLLISGNTIYFVLLLVRNLLVARLIAIEDYGIAATFAISMAVVQMMSDLGLQQLIIQDRDGDDQELQATLQGFQVFRSVISGVVLFLLAGPIARFLSISEVTWAFQLLAVTPILAGFVHFDIHRVTRSMVFLPTVQSKVFPALVSLVMVWPLYKYFGDYRVMLYALLGQSVATLLVSHLVAKRPYRLGFDLTIVRRAFKFGWPLLLNSVLLFAVFHGEKIVVGRELGMAELAIFAMGITLTLQPVMVIISSVQSFFLPQLSAAKDDPKLFGHLSRTLLQLSLLNGTVFVLLTTMFYWEIVTIMLSDEYFPLVPLLTWLAILQSLRMFKSGAAITSVAYGKTSNAMLANIFRVVSIPVSWYFAATTGNVYIVVAVATVGESLGYLTSLILLRYRIGITLSQMILPIVATLAIMGLAGMKDSLLSSTGFLSNSLNYWIVMVFMMLVLIASMGDLRRYLLERILRRKPSSAAD